MRDRIIGLERVKASELLRNPLNFRKHPRAQRAALRGILEEVGIASALVARRSDDGLVLIDGHLRADLDPDQVLPVVVLDVSQAEADKLLASLDPIGEMARANSETLLDLLGQVQTDDEGLADLFEDLRRRAQDDLKRLLSDPDEIPSKVDVRTRPGDLIELGRHRLICGDARDPAVLEGLMGDDEADLLLTDPPYGVDYVGKTKDRLKIRNDRADGLGDLLQAAFACCEHVSKKGAAFYVFSPSAAEGVVFAQAILAQDWDLRQTLIWVKDRPVPGHGDFAYQHEPILYGYMDASGKGRGVGGFYGGNGESSVIQVPKPSASRGHPTMKPTGVLKPLVSNSTRSGGIVLDPFAGSGSTLVACEQLGRRARLVEIDPAYCDVIIARYQQVIA